MTTPPPDPTAGDDRDAPESTAGTVTVFWRPGCGFCLRLDRHLGRLAVPNARRNIWDDPEAAAYVRSVAGGNETVPTVVVGDVALVNPSSDQVVAALREHAPELAPAAETVEAARGVVGRTLHRLFAD